MNKHILALNICGGNSTIHVFHTIQMTIHGASELGCKMGYTAGEYENYRTRTHEHRTRDHAIPTGTGYIRGLCK